MIDSWWHRLLLFLLFLRRVEEVEEERSIVVGGSSFRLFSLLIPAPPPEAAPPREDWLRDYVSFHWVGLHVLDWGPQPGLHRVGLHVLDWDAGCCICSCVAKICSCSFATGCSCLSKFNSSRVNENSILCAHQAS